MSEVFGIDVSHHNGHIDWRQVAGSGKKFAIMKCQYEAKSHRPDETFEYNYTEAGKYGLARGVYIYIATASIMDPVADANALLEKLRNRPLEYGIWLDLEDISLRGQGKEAISRLVNVYAKIFRAAGYYVGIYCNLDWYKNVLDSKNLEKEFDFWIARYPMSDTGVYNPNSRLKPTMGVAWQYSSKGNVPGIPRKVDLNVDFDGVVNLSKQTKTSTKPITPDLISKVISGVFGTGNARAMALTNEGFDPEEVRRKVNELYSLSKEIEPIKQKAGEYWPCVLKF